MAQIVYGIGTSHSPQLATPAENWAQRGESDKRNQELIGNDGIVSNYEDLLARADTVRIAKEITPEKFQKRHEENQKSIARLSETLSRVDPDILVMFGDDQHEYLNDDNLPAAPGYFNLEDWIAIIPARSIAVPCVQ